MPRELDATNLSSITSLWSDDGYQVFGYELEVNGLSVSRSKQVLRDNNLTYCWVTSDSTDVVDAEIVFPPLPNCDLAWNKIREVMEALENSGARVGLVDLGGHVHISARRVLTMDMVSFTNKACELAMQSFEEGSNDKDQRQYPSLDYYGDMFSYTLCRDVIKRYATFQPSIDEILAPSRRNYRMAQPVPNALNARFDNINCYNEMANYLGGKFRVINVNPLTTTGAIEFRQHQATLDAKKLRAWVTLIMNMFKWSDNYRLDYQGEQTTEEQPFRRFSRNGTAWEMCRTENGATVRELMDAIGWTPNNVRRTISEWRARFGDDVVQTIGQQNNGASYRDGDTHTRYIVRQVMGGGISVLPENRAGTPSIWGGLDDEWYEFFMERRHELSR